MPAGPNDLVTLAQAYAWLNITPGTDDADLQAAITEVSQLIATWCSRNFVQASYSETYSGRGSQILTLRNWPVTAVASLSIDGTTISARSGPLGNGYASDGERQIGLNGYCFTRGFQNISIAYTAGYATIPADLQMACLEWLKEVYLSSDRPSDVQMERAGDHEVRYLAGGAVFTTKSEVAPMPATVFAVLSQYRDVVPA